MRVAACLFLLVVCAANNVFADLLTFDLTTDKSVYNVGETVTWQTTIALSGVAGSNFGVHTVSFDLQEDQGLAMNLATIAAPFSGYTFPNTGNNIAEIGKLLNVGVGQFGYDSSKVKVTALDPGPTLLATGTFTAGVPGPHTLTLIADPSQYYNSNVPGTLPGVFYDSLVGDAVNFNVNANAVPEPSTMVLSLLGAATTLGYSLRRRAKANRAKSRSADLSHRREAI